VIEKPLPSRLTLLLLLGFVFIAYADTFHIGFYADDFVFFDAVRRMPVLKVLIGQYGIYPWYRPLSRELFFYLLLATGPYAHLVAHVIGLTTLAISAWALWQIAESVQRGTGPAAAVLYLTCDFTKFLGAWASGYQDTLSVTLILLALLSHLRGRPRLTLLFAFLAPFAKETGIIAMPLVMAFELMRSRRIPAPLIRDSLVVVGCAAAVHALVRTLWVTGGTSFKVHPSLHGLAVALSSYVASFLSVPRAVPAWPQVVLIGIALALLFVITRSRNAAAERSRPGLRWFPLVAVGFALAPLVGGYLLAISGAQTYYAYPATPWMALALAQALSFLGSAFRLPATLAIAAFNLVGLAYAPPHLDSVAGWVPSPPSWSEAIRLSAVTRRLGDDLRSQAPRGADSLVVVYHSLSYGSFFQQSADGPATRELLGDPRVQAYFISDAPPTLASRYLAVFGFDPHRFHFFLEPRDAKRAAFGAMSAIAIGRPGGSRVWELYAAPAVPDPILSYLSATTELVEHGASAYASRWRAIRDLPYASSGYEGLIRDSLAADPRRALRPEVHLSMADSLFAHEHLLESAVELRAAIALGIDTGREHLKLGLILTELGVYDAAQAELQTAIGRGDAPWAGVAANALRDLRDMLRGKAATG
jgi:hypothetical protein